MRRSSCIAIVLTLLLSLASVAVGTVRGQADPVGAHTLCRGNLTVTVFVDAEGQPTGAPHICPDCTLLLLAGLSGDKSAPLAITHARDMVTYWHPDGLIEVWRIPEWARGPPLARLLDTV